MNKMRKITYFLAALTILAGVLAVAAPDKAAAKWLSLKHNYTAKAPAATVAETTSAGTPPAPATQAEVMAAAGSAATSVPPAPAATVVVTAAAEAVADVPEATAAKVTVPAAADREVVATVRVEVANPRVVVSSRKPDVGPGVEGLDYSKVVKWQQDVDAGRDLWRLDPLEVAKREGKAFYGFSEADTFTVIRTQDASAIARHGQVDVEVKHDGKTYTMVIVRPFGGGGAIWTTYSVTGAPLPQPPAEKVIFSTDKYAGWDWYKGSYPHDMAMAVVADYEAQLENDDRIPEFVLARAKDVDYARKVVLFAYLGSGGGADAIGIEKVTLVGNSMTVYVHTRSIKPGEVETKNLTHPSDFVAINRKIVDIWGGVNITFVDQQGKVLGKAKVSVNHRS